MPNIKKNIISHNNKLLQKKALNNQYHATAKIKTSAH